MTVLIRVALGKGLKSNRGKGVFKFGAKVIASLTSLPWLLQPRAALLSPGLKKAAEVTSLHSYEILRFLSWLSCGEPPLWASKHLG